MDVLWLSLDRCIVIALGDLLQVARNLTNKMGSVVVPQDKIGKLIGPRGAVINKIRADTGMSGMLNILHLSHGIMCHNTPSDKV